MRLIGSKKRMIAYNWSSGHSSPFSCHRYIFTQVYMKKNNEISNLPENETVNTGI